MRRQSGAGALAALMLTCVFGVTLLLSLAAGAGVYRRVADRTEQNAQDRVSLSYITAKLHAADAAGQVEAGSFGDGGALFLYEEIEGSIYETVLYVYDGYLMEILREKGSEQDPEFGEMVCPAQMLEVSEQQPGLLWLTLTGPDGGIQTAGVYVRSDG
jgi:hypothetical protein